MSTLDPNYEELARRGSDEEYEAARANEQAQIEAEEEDRLEAIRYHLGLEEA